MASPTPTSEQDYSTRPSSMQTLFPNSFPVSDLPHRAQFLPNGKKRKTPLSEAATSTTSNDLPSSEISRSSKPVSVQPVPKEVRLQNCPLKELVQYECDVVKTKKWTKDQPREDFIECKPIVRLFRQCAGGVTVETTAWEGPLKTTERGST